MIKKINKRGSTLTNWVYVILLVSLFLVLFQSQVLNPMNALYGKNYSVGLEVDADSAISNLNTQTSTSKGDIQNGTITAVSDGITLVQVGSIAKGVFNTIGDFVSGRFLRVLLTDQLGLPAQMATVLTIMILLSLIFIMVRIFMRGVTP